MRKIEVFVSAVVYLNDNCERVIGFIDQLITQLDSFYSHYEVIVVDDCCKKQDEFLVDYLSTTNNKNITVVHMSVKQGIETCMRAGIDTAIGDFVYEFDTFEFDFESDLVAKAYKKAIEGNDIVSVEIKKNSLSRNIFYRLFNRFSNTDYDIHASVFRLVSRRAINRVLSLNMNCEFRQAVYASCGLKNGSVEYQGMASKKKSRDVSLAIDSFILYTNLPKTVCIESIRVLIALCVLFIPMVILNCVYDERVIQSILIVLVMCGILVCGICLIFLLTSIRLLIKGSNGQNNYLIENIQKIEK